ncbi:hypothetical protein PVAND_001152 [Polypedilum vanderplanki]|uniref:Uncharacterized protein n=1 Tax=Polypedilum vanderplanki TaxID=319348 RepID=A0A9J6BNB3_POLVA|nr:hypothetical protein PVAND_001152 [Polypedilum vanderplanki]
MMDKENINNKDDNKNQDPEDPIKYKDEDKPSRILRVITVVIYLTSVSMVALLLSLYYIFFWTPQREYTSRLEGTDEMNQDLDDYHNYHTHGHT